MQKLNEHIRANASLKPIIHIFEMMEQPVLVIDKEGRIRYANPRAIDAYEFGWNEPAGNPVEMVGTDPDMGEVLRQYEGRMEEGEMIDQEILMIDRSGRSMRKDFTISLLSNAHENLFVMVEKFQKPEVNLLSKANQIMSEVDSLLGSEVNYETMIKKVVGFIAPELADICTIHLVQADGFIDRTAFAGDEPSFSLALQQWLEDDLPNDETDGLPGVLHKGEPTLIPMVNPVRRAAKAGIKSYMILPLITHKKIKGAITLIATDSRRSFDHNSLELVRNLAINISIYLEKNRLYNESMRLREELEQRVNDRTRELQDAISQLKQSEQMNQTLFRISNMLNATLDVDLILDELALEAIRIVNGESGFAGLRTPDGMQVKKYFHNGEAISFEHTWAIGEGIPGWVLKYKVPYGTSDAENDPLILRDLKINDNVRSVICTPILDSVGDVLAYFDIRNKLGAEGFSINDQEMLLTLAPVASIAIQNAIAYQRRLENVAELKETSRQLEELAARLESTREEERLRISRELHDQLGQSLTALKFDITSLTSQIKHLDENLAQKSKDITTQINTMIKTVRRISTELRPGMLDDLGLVASIEWLASDFEKRTGIECRVNATSTQPNLNREQSLVLYRIFQESLTNVTRYARAKHIDITLTTNGEQVEFVFHDDGRGIRREEITGVRSLGLVGMRERVKHIGGTFSINGYPEKGTTIKVTIPVQQENSLGG